MLQSMGSQRVVQNLVPEQQQIVNKNIVLMGPNRKNI